MNILFTPENAEWIKLGRKVTTARHWKQKPPEVGDIVTASTGRKKETRFAELRILDVRKWNGRAITSAGHDYVPFKIATKEGFREESRIIDFLDAYRALNRHHWYEKGRAHYFIDFEVVNLL